MQTIGKDWEWEIRVKVCSPINFDEKKINPRLAWKEKKKKRNLISELGIILKTLNFKYIIRSFASYIYNASNSFQFFDEFEIKLGCSALYRISVYNKRPIKFSLRRASLFSESITQFSFRSPGEGENFRTNYSNYSLEIKKNIRFTGRIYSIKWHIWDDEDTLWKNSSAIAMKIGPWI